MNMLLDTHVFLWWLDDPLKISQEAASAIRDQDNLVYIGAATIWEIVIKQSLGKLDAPHDLMRAYEDANSNPFPSKLEHVQSIRLPAIYSIAILSTECLSPKRKPTISRW